MDEDPSIKILAEELELNKMGTLVSIRCNDGHMHSIKEIIDEQTKLIRALEILLIQKGIIVDENELRDIVNSIDVLKEMTEG